MSGGRGAGGGADRVSCVLWQVGVQYFQEAGQKKNFSFRCHRGERPNEADVSAAPEGPLLLPAARCPLPAARCPLPSATPCLHFTRPW